ncbi:hemoglobin/transferrin/lactoferrin receptor protein [Nitratireductor indicus]|nr:hemoglobin/transferrin/lactoferrin receptor protein [Nitratireductor indicus]
MGVTSRTISRLMTATILAGFTGLVLVPAQAFGQESATNTAEKTGRVTLLDRLTISATWVDEAAIDALAAESHVDREELERIQPNTAADVFRSVPGVAASMNGDDPATAINIRGMQQYGRVVVTLDGARQDYWRVGHGSGSFYVEPELLKEVTVIRGPVSNTFGTGGIGGVVAFETMDARDFLKSNERWALSEKLSYETNGKGFLTSTTGAYRFTDNFDVIGNLVYRDLDAYKDGNGDTVPWTENSVLSGYLKGSFRFAEDQELKLGMVQQKYNDFITGSSGSPSASLSRYDADTVNRTYTASYTYNPAGNDLIDFGIDVYHNETRADQYQVWPSSRIGNTRYYDVSTTGFNARNSSRFDAYGLAHTLTYGGDFHHLEGDSDADHFGAGSQDSGGAFLQWKGEYSDWLEVIAALRYDAYQLDGQTKTLEDASLSGNRWSPRLSVAVTPFEGFQVYGSYSEGYRAPTLQDVFRGGGAHGSGNSYVPNLLLQPEVAKSWEAGVNIKLDDVLVANDSLRGKINLFHTKVEDYIDVDLTNPIRSARNLGDARLRGIEVEGLYDFNWGFVNLSGALVDAEFTSGVYAGQPLTNTPLDRFSATLGFRAFDERLTYGAQFLSVGEITRTSRSDPTAALETSDGFQLVNLFADWKVNEHTRLGFGVENLFNEKYTDPQSSWSSSAATEQGKGRTFKVSLTGRIGG